MRKTAPLGALQGLTLETLLVAPLAAGALLLWTSQGHSAFAIGSTSLIAWLLLAGPLLLFAAGARRLPLTTLGLVQYISPSMQLAPGVWLFREPLEPARLVAFGCIWAGLAVYSVEGCGGGRRW